MIICTVFTEDTRTVRSSNANHAQKNPFGQYDFRLTKLSGRSKYPHRSLPPRVCCTALCTARAEKLHACASVRACVRASERACVRVVCHPACLS